MMSDREAALKAVNQTIADWGDEDPERSLDIEWGSVEIRVKHLETIRAALSEPEWIMINSLDDLPKKTEKFYQQIDCLVYHNGEIKHLVWNCEHGVWDREDGDDFYCNPLEPKAYIPFPSPPKGKTP